MKTNILLSLVTVLFAVFFLILSLQLPDSSDGIGAGGWPSMLLILMILLAVTLIIQTFVARNKEEKVKNTDSEEPEKQFNKERVTETIQTKGHEQKQAATDLLRKFCHWVVMVVTIIYFLSIQLIGFALATPFFFMIMMKMLGMRNWLLPLLISLLFTICIVGLFTGLLSVPLPRGTGIFREIHLFLY